MEHPRIDLAHESDFAIASLNVHPSTRELSRDGERLVVEPRVMQVLVALFRAGGAVVSKHDLAMSCWEGRVVGEDAINRVLSRLRKVSDSIGKGSFHVETVTRVGYRMVIDGEIAEATANESALASLPVKALDRRAVIAGTGLALGGGAGALYFFNRRSSVPSDLAALLDRAQAAMQYHTPEQTASAVGLLRDATRMYPDRAEVWGKLAIAYHQQGWSSPRSDSQAIMDYGESAARRALELDPTNVDGSVFLAVPKSSYYKNWLEYDRACQNVLSLYSRHFVAARTCAAFLFSVGRVKDSLKATQYLVELATPSPQILAMHAQKLWASGRVDEAATLFESALSRWPRHHTVWFAYHRFLTYSGRPQAAEAMVADVNARPVGVPQDYFQLHLASSQAIRTNAPKDSGAALERFVAMVRSNPSIAEPAAIFATAIGNLDASFNLLGRMYLPKMGNSNEGIGGHSGQLTYFLFLPPMKAARADGRFDDITALTGLQNYWRKANVRPDYLS